MTTMTDRTPRARIAEQAQNYKAEGVDFAELIRVRFNCAEAHVDDDGDVWIAGPQTGHWLKDDALNDLADWIEENG